MCQYADCIGKMQIYISSINSMLDNHPYHSNQDGLFFSLADYTVRTKNYELRVKHFETQNKLADRQRKDFKQALLKKFKQACQDSSIAVKPIGGKLSKASLVQQKLREQKENLQNTYASIICMRQIHNECDRAVSVLHNILSVPNQAYSKLNLQEQSAKDQEMLFAWRNPRRRTNSFSGYPQSDDDDISPQRQRCDSL